MIEPGANESVPQPQRPWWHLHLSTWLLLPLGLFGLILLTIPGELGWYPDRDSARPREAIVHGWPWSYLWRTPNGWTNDVTKASPISPWALTDSIRQFHLLPLLFDLAAAACCLAAFVALLEIRRRRLRRSIQFTLRGLMLGVTLAAMGLGWWSYERAADQEVRSRILRLSGRVQMVPNVALWIRVLTGDGYLSGLGRNRPKDFGFVEWNVANYDDIRFIIDRFPSEIELAINKGISNQDATAIASIDRLERVECLYNEPTDFDRLFARLESHPHLRYLRIVNTRLSDDEMASIATLPQLESLSVCNASGVTDKGLAHLQKCSRLRNLEMDCAELSSLGLQRLADLRQLRWLDITSAKFLSSDIAEIAKLDGLDELDLWAANLTDEHARQLRHLTRLRVLNVFNTKITKVGLRALLGPTDHEGLVNLESIHVGADLIDDEFIADLNRATKLRTISVYWDFGYRRFDNSPPKDYAKFILDLQRELPDREIISVPVASARF